MNSFRKELWFDVPTRRAFLDITLHVKAALSETRITEGFRLIFTKHI